MEDVLAITLLFSGCTLFLLAISPIGRALASRIEGKAKADPGDLAELHDHQQSMAEELQALREEVTDMQERLDFTERFMTAHRKDQLPPPDVQD